jgi:EAL domain-containing protein (putative c-di-GMP-specific phosphodiesterase class I)
MLRAPFRLRDGDVELLFSVGTALGRRGMTAATLLHQALVALNQSQRTQVGGTRAFDATADEDIRRRVGLRQDLREAITSGDFTLHLQPMVALADGAWVGAEALVRWRHPVFGLQSPGLFLSVSEQTGQILDIDDWALRHAAGLAARLNQGGLDQGPLAVSVNLSAPRLRHANLAPMLAAVLRDTGADPASLRIEIAEPVLAGGSGAMIEDLRRLRAMGVGIVIDDFGVGGSSLSSLDTLPVTEIKIDRGFIQDCESSAYHQLVIGSFVAIGRTLAIAVTAKGVANEAQRRVLERLGVRQAQGFLFGAPIDAAEFTALARPRGGSGPAAAGGHRLE